MEVFTNQEQVRLLLQSLLLGVGIGLVYDVLRALRRHFACGRAATAAYDTVFWLVTAAALFEFGIVFAIGQTRFFALAGAVCGACVYFALLSDAVLAVLGGLLVLAARLWGAAASAARRIYSLAERLGPSEKFRAFAKKIQKSSSIFRRKGIK